MTRPLLGVALQPEERFWRHNRALIESAELFEVTPETLWDARCEPTEGHERLRRFVRVSGRPCVGHGVLASIGAAERPARRDRWLAALRRDAAAFGCRWLSEHLGFADAGGAHVAWPLPLPNGRRSGHRRGRVAARAALGVRRRVVREQRRPVLSRRAAGAGGAVHAHL